MEQEAQFQRGTPVLGEKIVKSITYKMKLAEQYLQDIASIKSLWAMGLDARHMDVVIHDGYMAMLETTGKSFDQYPNGRQLAEDILNGKA